MVLSEEQQPKKKNKAKKVPLRGLGVAQLEKLRIEEQQKKQHNNNNTEFSSPPSNIINIPSLPSFTLPMSSNRDPGPLFRSCFSSSSSSSSSSSHVIDFFQSVKHSPVQMVNRAALVPTLSGENVQIEPPSLQSYLHSSCSDQERIAGINNQWPFHPEIMSFSYKNPHLGSSMINPNEPASLDGKVPFKFDYKNTIFSRDSSSNSSLYPIVDWKNSDVHMRKRQRENCDTSDNTFLALGASSTHPVSRTNLSMNVPPTQRQERHEFSILPSQTMSASRQPFYSFLPEEPMDHDIDKEQRSKAMDDVDTRLKL